MPVWVSIILAFLIGFNLASEVPQIKVKRGTNATNGKPEADE